MEAVEEKVEGRSMEGAKLFFSTDNSMAESVYYQGNTATRIFLS